MTKKTLPKEHTVVQDETYPHMYRIQYPDGTISNDMWNKKLAQDHLDLYLGAKESFNEKDNKG